MSNFVRTVSKENNKKRRRTSKTVTTTKKLYGKLNNPLQETKFFKFKRAVISVGDPGETGISVFSDYALAINGTGLWDFGFTYQLSGVQMYLGGTSYRNFPMANYTDWTVLFDQFRIDAVDIEMIYNHTVGPAGQDVGGGNNAQVSMPIIYSCEDHDDMNASTQNIMVQRSGLKTFQVGNAAAVGNKMKWRVYPTPLETVWQTSILSGYERGSNKKWQNTAYPGTQYYGTKHFIDMIHNTGGNIVAGYMHFTFTYHISFRDVK